MFKLVESYPYVTYVYCFKFNISKIHIMYIPTILLNPIYTSRNVA